MKLLLRTPLAQSILASLLGGYLSFVLRTTRWTLEGKEHFVAHATGGPAIFAFWHEFLPLVPALVLIFRKQHPYDLTPIHALISQHRDGRFISAAIARFGIQSIQGSTTRGGAAGLRNLLTVLKKGDIVGITPDGPKGPRRQAASGVAQLAALAGAPILPVAARTKRFLQLNSWDRMRVPLPFGRGVIVCGPAIHVARAGWQDAVPVITEALNAVAAKVDSLWAKPP
jgi:lysophospholipid acyltransferase (LPLAT)-like uncharacterized protein